jgi:hypothetical protein
MSGGEKIKEIFKEMFAKLDEMIKSHYTNFEELRDIYFEFLEYIKKEKAGTSGGFTGLSEYLILKAILLHLEQKLSVEFEKSLQKIKDAHFFVSKDKEILVTHGININEDMESIVKEKFGYGIIWSKDKNTKRLRPDIVIFKLTNNYYKPEAIIQIKVYAVSPNAIINETNKVRKMASGSGKPLCAIIFFCEVGKHREKLEGFGYVVTPKNPVEFEKMLQEIERRLLPTSFISDTNDKSHNFF